MLENNLKFAVIGGGRLGGALAAALEANGLHVAAVTRSGDDNIAKTKDADAVFLAVPDGKIAAVAAELAAAFAGENPVPRYQYAFHVSGATTLAPLAPLKERGVHVGSFHPLQSFTPQAKENPAIWRGVYAAIAGDAEALNLAQEIAARLGVTALVVPDSPAARARYHAAACIASNYLVALMNLAETLFVDEMAGVSRRDALHSLLPLVSNTVANLAKADCALDALTGPIARGDAGTVRGHLAALPPECQNVYRSLGASLAAALKEKNKGGNAAYEEILSLLS